MSTQEKFGFGMNEGRMLDLDLVDERLNDKLTQKVPSCVPVSAVEPV
jgi:hypothetical protein